MAPGDEIRSTLDRLGSSLTTAVLGALILWIGQTTFRQAGMLDGLDERIVAIHRQFEAIEQRQETQRRWLENAVSDLKGNRARFTQGDSDRLNVAIRQLEQASSDQERRFAERQAAMELKLAAVETSHRDSQEIAALKGEIAQLRSDLARAAVAQETQAQGNDRVARGVPVFLPPVESRR